MIQLSQAKLNLYGGAVGIVDARDMEFLSQRKWHKKTYQRANQKALFYVAGWFHPTEKKLHKIIYERHRGPIPRGLQIDHINGDGLDNRLSNLRASTTSQNAMNRPMQANNTSGYKGVVKDGLKWRAQIQFQGKRQYLGKYLTRAQAAVVYLKASIKLFGEFSHICRGYDRTVGGCE